MTDQVTLCKELNINQLATALTQKERDRIKKVLQISNKAHSKFKKKVSKLEKEFTEKALAILLETHKEPLDVISKSNGSDFICYGFASYAKYVGDSFSFYNSDECSGAYWAIKKSYIDKCENKNWFAIYNFKIGKQTVASISLLFDLNIFGDIATEYSKQYDEAEKECNKETKGINYMHYYHMDTPEYYKNFEQKVLSEMVVKMANGITDFNKLLDVNETLSLPERILSEDELSLDED